MKQLSAAGRQVIAAVVAITVIGFALRLARYEQSVFGDETSTLYIVDGRSLSDLMRLLSGDAEISPPLFFILAWLSAKLGSMPELVRLPSLVAGTVSIPLVYMVGARAVNRPAGLIAASVMALNPFMIFYSGDGRGYAVAIALLLGSTLAMLAGARDGRTRWWVLYGALSLLAMYTHYTSAFVLVAQLGWLFWAYPQARKPAVIANLAAAVLFLPWVPELIDDLNSPTVDILSALQGDGFGAKRQAIEIWAVGYPFQTPHQLPGVVAIVLGLVGFVLACVTGVFRHLRARSTLAGRDAVPLLSKGMTLVLALAAATAVFELLILFVTGNDLLGARNLATSSAGLALLIGAVLASAGRLVGTICTVAVLACFAIGAIQTLGSDAQLPNTKSAAAYIDERAETGDVVLDLHTSPLVNPVPVDAFTRYLASPADVATPFLPVTPPPLLLPATASQVEGDVHGAVCDAAGGRLFVLDGGERIKLSDGRIAISTEPPSLDGSDSGPEAVAAPPGSEILARTRFNGADALFVSVIGIPHGESGRLPPCNR